MTDPLTEARKRCRKVHPERWSSVLNGADRACLSCLEVTVAENTAADAQQPPGRDRQAEIECLRGAVIRARFALTLALEAACPGPHSYVQHRDNNPPWCRVCGRARNGDPLGDYPPVSHGNAADDE